MLPDKPLYQCFVSPGLCSMLHDAGLKIQAPFCWRFTGTKACLFSLVFDEDHYYQQALENINHIDQLVLIPAFQIKDMEKLLPDYMLTKNNVEYELFCSSLFEFDVQKSNRLPDVFAYMVIKGIEQRKIDVSLAIKKITTKI